jgi:hypothetical protein
MENLSPSIEILLALRHGLVCGESPRRVLENILRRKESLELASLAHFAMERMNHPEILPPPAWTSSSLRRAVLYLLQRALQGQPVLPFLDRVSEVAWQQYEIEQRLWLQKRPFLALLPLLLLQLPALGLELFFPFLEFIFSLR